MCARAALASLWGLGEIRLGSFIMPAVLTKVMSRGWGEGEVKIIKGERM